MFFQRTSTGESPGEVLTFSGDITVELLDGDAITLDENSILLNGRTRKLEDLDEDHLKIT